MQGYMFQLHGVQASAVE